jgi:hypothetical protein
MRLAVPWTLVLFTQGLGKTVQTIAFIVALLNPASDVPRDGQVHYPTSRMHPYVMHSCVIRTAVNSCCMEACPCPAIHRRPQQGLQLAAPQAVTDAHLS